MSQHGKRHNALRQQVEPGRKYSVEEAISLVKATATAKFDETVDVAVRLGVNPRQADQMVRGAISLPHGTGKSVRVLVFAEGDAAKAALEAGADFVGGNELIEKILNEGWVDFDKAISVRALMARVGRLGRVLGPRGLMPNPKTGTVVGPEDVASVVREVKGGRVDFRVEKAGVVHAPIAKASMEESMIRENFLALMSALVRAKPSTSKGTYVRSVALSATMGVGVRVDANEVVRLSTEAR